MKETGPSCSQTPVPPQTAEGLQATHRGMARLLQAVQDLSQARNVEEIREIVRHAARELTGADGATFVLRDGDSCHYVDEDAISPLWKGMRFPITACISGWAMLNRQSAMIPDIYADPRIPADAYRPTFVQSLIVVPIRKDAPLGAIGNYWATHHSSCPEEVELLQALANTTAVAMENVRVYAELEQRVQDRTRELQEANRELEAFSYSISHDLRAPLRHVLGFLGLLESEAGIEENELAQRYMGLIRGAATRMQHLIEDLLGLARLSRQAMNWSPVDLGDLVSRVIGDLHPDCAERNIQWLLDPLPVVHGDESLLRAAFQNLLGNAVKFTSHRPEAVIRVGVSEESPSEWTVAIADNGAGFDPAYAHKLFGVFQRLHDDEEFEGTGIGLANVQRIVHRHRGRVWAQGIPDQGATFFLALPKVSAACP